MPISAKTADRREYFRIHDQAALKYQVIDRVDVEKTLTRRREGFPDLQALACSFASSNLDMKHAIEKCRRELPEVAIFLDGLNTKLDLLLRVLISSNSALPDHPTHDLNLSASGLSFKVAGEVPEGSLLEVELLFFPSFLYMLTFGRVVRCIESDETEGFPYELAVEFSHLEDNDREMLIRHILQKESALLRRAQDGAVSDD